MARRVVIGALPTGGYGLRVSPPGIDALTASDDQLVFSSEWATLFPIYVTGVSGFVSTTGTYRYSFSSLGYIPLGFAMAQISGRDWRPAREFNPNQFSNVGIIQVAFTASSATFFLTNLPSGSIRFAWKIFKVPV
jgi:hypothetical protein